MKKLMFSGTDVTLYVPCYNAGDTLPQCLDGIRCLSVLPSRIILIDDGSDVPVEVDGAEVIRHAENRGLAAARNTALHACETSLIASLDADVVTCPEWLETLLDAMNSGDWAGVGGKLIERTTDTVADRWRAVHMAQNRGEEAVVCPEFLFGSNTLYRSEPLRSVGGYDDRLRTNNEDRTISDALYSAGHKLLYQADAVCEHLKCDTEQTILRSYWQWHHAKGLIEGDYDSIDGIISRISRVNFGIARHCYEMDVAAGRREFIDLDLLIPWAFCYFDLELFAQRTGAPSVAGLIAELTGELPARLSRLLYSMINLNSENKRSEAALLYAREFRKAMELSGWKGRVWDVQRRL